MEVCRYGDASKTVVLDKYTCWLSTAVFEDGAEPGVDEARYVDGSRSDEVMPACESVVAMPEEDNHENDDGGEVTYFKEFVSKAPRKWFSGRPQPTSDLDVKAYRMVL